MKQKIMRIIDNSLAFLDVLRHFVPTICIALIVVFCSITGVGAYSKRADSSNRFNIINGKADGKYLIENFGDSFVVSGVLNNGDNYIKNLYMNILALAPTVVVCKPSGYFKGTYRSHEQTVQVLDVIKGDKSISGSEITYTGMLGFSHSNYLDKQFGDNGADKVTYSYINFMNPDYTYILFLFPYGINTSGYVEEEEESGETFSTDYHPDRNGIDKPGWYTLENEYWCPSYFNLTEFKTKNVPVKNDNGNYVTTYSEVKDNEVFVANRKTEKWFYSFKKDVLLKYLSKTSWLDSIKGDMK